MMREFVLLLFVGCVASVAGLPDLLRLGSQQRSNLNNINLEGYLRKMLENFREDMHIGIPQFGVPPLDPFYKDHVNIDVDNPKAKVKANIYDLTIVGVSGFDLRVLQIKLSELSLRVRIALPLLRADGHYDLDGKVISIIPLRGNGSCMIEAEDLSFEATATLNTTEDGKLYFTDDLDLHVEFSRFNVNFENLLGGGQWIDILTKLVNSMAKKVFDKMLDQFKGDILGKLREAVNKEMSNLPLENLLPSENANDYVDQLLENARKQIALNNLDPAELPETSADFSKDILGITWHGIAKMHDGYLEGLSTIQRTGDADLQADEDIVRISAQMGIRNLYVAYSGTAEFMGIGPTIHLTGKLSSLDIYFRVSQKNEKGSNPELEELQVIDIHGLRLEISGLGPLTWIWGQVLGLLTNALQTIIANKAAEAVRDMIREQLKEVTLPFGK